MSKTTKLLLLDSLLQEVCIESGSDGSLALSSLGLSVCLVSHNLLYSGLKKAHSKKKSVSKRKIKIRKCVVEILVLKKSCFLLAGRLLYGHMKKTIFCFHLTKGFGSPLGPPAWSIGSSSVGVLSVGQSDGHKRQNYAKCLQQPVFPGGHPSKY